MLPVNHRLALGTPGLAERSFKKWFSSVSSPILACSVSLRACSLAVASERAGGTGRACAGGAAWRHPHRLLGECWRERRRLAAGMVMDAEELVNAALRASTQAKTSPSRHCPNGPMGTPSTQRAPSSAGTFRASTRPRAIAAHPRGLTLARPSSHGLMKTGRFPNTLKERCIRSARGLPAMIAALMRRSTFRRPSRGRCRTDRGPDRRRAPAALQHLLTAGSGFLIFCDMRDVLNWRKVAGFSIGLRVQRRVPDEVQVLWRATWVMPVMRRAPCSKVM